MRYTPVIINNAGFTNGVQIIVNGELYSYLLGDDSYSEIYPTLKENADADAFESWLDNWCSEQPGTHWLSYRQSSDEMAESFAQVKMNCTPFVRQYDILSNKWGVLLCQKEYQTNDIRRSSREWL